MAKQIKIGHDKVPAPVTETYVPLYDVFSGTPLRDVSGNIIVTPEDEVLASFILGRNSAPVFITNKNPDEVFLKYTRDGSVYIKKDAEGNPLTGIGSLTIPVEEVFAETTEVSNTLLGVPRSEQQLSLFSDVSTYGLDVDNWTHYEFSGSLEYPSEWYRRKNPVYGPRSGVQFKEYTEEQALALRAYPVQYSYPFGPTFEDTGRYNENLFTQYKRFIGIGKELYNYYNSLGYTVFANENFIPDFIDFVNQNRTPIDVSVVVGANGQDMENVGNAYDIEYGDDLNLAFEHVERWTVAFNKLLNNALLTPVSVPQNIVKYIRNNPTLIRPGYSTGSKYYGLLESVDTFRYQPGRISGFTFGIRMQTDSSNLENVVEWGASNDTDQYMFQIRGGEFNIIRRSTIPLTADLLKRMNLTEADQTDEAIYSEGIDQKYPMYVTTIPRQRFNGDTLDGNGESGYNLSADAFKNVTMYKIEYSWYGAVGVSFYAYVPTGHDGARWVKIHTMVIENGLDKPILQQPDFKFRYFISLNNTGSVTEPVYVYKYGASYYIDGGDEGTLRMNASDSITKDFDSIFKKGALGLHPKSFIQNADGDFLPNRMKAYPVELSATTDSSAKITVREINGSPDGMHFHYSPSLHNGVSSNSKNFKLTVTDTGGLVLEDPEGDPTLSDQTLFGPEDKQRKIVADGIYNYYLNPESGQAFTNLQRRYTYNLQTRGISDQIILSDGTVIENTAGYTFTAKCMGYDEVVASSTPISSPEFTINWLNPVGREGTYGSRHWSDFAIAVTYEEPAIVSITDPNDANNTIDVVRFGTDEREIDILEEAPAEFSQYGHQQNLDGQSITEWDPTWGIRFDIDPRLSQPPGSDSGIISKLAGKVQTVTVGVNGIENTNTADGSTHRLILESPLVGITENDVAKIDLGVAGKTSGITVMSVPNSEIQNDVVRYYIDVLYGEVGNPGDITAIPGWDASIDYKLVSMSDDFRLTGYETVNGELTSRFGHKTVQTGLKSVPFTDTKLYVVIGMMDGAKLNNIILEELYAESKVAKTPQWLIAEGSSVDIVLSGGSTLDRTPSNFADKDRLSSIRFDSSCEQPLRPGKEITQLLIAENETRKFDLSNIFNYDRKKITTGLYNDRAYYFTVEPIGTGNTGGTIRLALTVKEQ